jgi:tRNA threonylcarbamoyl adenosine modification protein (Sua5/YciO/YrdC/YwlC family)
MKRITIDPGDIDAAFIREIRDQILQGKIVALPTETVYGLAVRADKKEAVQRLYEIKERPPDKPFTLTVGSIHEAYSLYFSILPPFGYRLMERFWPGPLTLIYYSPEDEKVGVRVPAHRVAQEVLKGVGAPVYLPSANISGMPDATTAGEVEAALGEAVDLIVDSGPSHYARPSTVLDVTFYPFKMLRRGVVTEREIIEVFVKKRIIFVCTGNTCRSPLAEYLLKKYIALEKPYLKERCEIFSYGVGALEGSGPTSPIVTLLSEKEGLDARSFLSQRLDRETVLSSDLIFTMEEFHAKQIIQMEPTAAPRILPLRKFLPAEFEKDIPDPIGKSAQVYEEVYSLLKLAVLELVDWL